MRAKKNIFVLILSSFSLILFANNLQPVNKKKENEPKKVYLIHSDNLHYDQFINSDAQIAKGNVVFKQENVKMYCDSAYYYEGTNSFEAFGKVKILQGDTLSLHGDYVFYDGNTQIAEVRNNVVLKHRQTTLLTDSLNYDRMLNIGYFFEGGKLIDKENTLNSDWGEYSTATRMADFYYNVRLTNPNDTLTSDTLHYDTRKTLAEIVGPSNIVSGDSHIYTEQGFYNTKSEEAKLFGRSVVINKDRRIVGDSLFYDKIKGFTEGFGNVVYDDKKNKNRLTGNYCNYNSISGIALATDSAIAYDYSQKDTMYIHGDTLKMYSYNLDTDSLYRTIHAYNHVRAYRRDIQSVCDSLMGNSKTKVMKMFGNPIIWNNNQQILGEEIHTYMNDSTIDSVRVINQALLAEQIDSIHYNQVAGRLMRSYFKEGNPVLNQVDGNVQVIYYPYDSDSTMIGLNYTETSVLKMFMEKKKMKKIWTQEATGVLYPFILIPKDKMQLENFAWFDYIRPLNKDDIFEWRGKKIGTELKATVRREVPLQHLNKNPKARGGK